MYGVMILNVGCSCVQVGLATCTMFTRSITIVLCYVNVVNPLVKRLKNAWLNLFWLNVEYSSGSGPELHFVSFYYFICIVNEYHAVLSPIYLSCTVEIPVRVDESPTNSPSLQFFNLLDSDDHNIQSSCSVQTAFGTRWARNTVVVSRCTNPRFDSQGYRHNPVVTKGLLFKYNLKECV